MYVADPLVNDSTARWIRTSTPTSGDFRVNGSSLSRERDLAVSQFPRAFRCGCSTRRMRAARSWPERKAQFRSKEGRCLSRKTVGHAIMVKCAAWTRRTGNRSVDVGIIEMIELSPSSSLFVYVRSSLSCYYWWRRSFDRRVFSFRSIRIFDTFEKGDKIGV